MIVNLKASKSSQQHSSSTSRIPPSHMPDKDLDMFFTSSPFQNSPKAKQKQMRSRSDEKKKLTGSNDKFTGDNRDDR